VERPENEEAADEPFRVAHSHRFGRKSAGNNETGQKDCRNRASLHSEDRVSKTCTRAADRLGATVQRKIVRRFANLGRKRALEQASSGSPVAPEFYGTLARKAGGKVPPAPRSR
ncbi:MAG: hypothetical protein ACXWEX_06480, partial [Thermoanaerobaculia bacterium]